MASTDPGASDREGPRLRVVTSRFAGRDQGRLLVTGLVLVLAVVGAGAIFFPDVVPISSMFPLLVVAGLLLDPRRLRYFLGCTVVASGLWAPGSHLPFPRLCGVLVSLGIVMALVVVIARSRDRVGVRGFSGDRMFAELRDRIASVGRLPVLPDGWSASAHILSAHSDRFSGDFVIAHLDDDAACLEIALVDVSGKGTGAGTRSLLLSGALGGLLGAVPAADFLRAANDYLVRQGWEEGFATAVHVQLDLVTGEYTIANAGHPSPARYTSGRARWTVLDASRGPLLGVLPDVGFERQSGSLAPGDALLLYSDGVVEARDRDLTDGIDRMLGVAAMSVLREGDAARDVCEAARSGEDDDRAAVVVRRR